MKRIMKTLLLALLCLAMSLSACLSAMAEAAQPVTTIVLSDEGVLVDGAPAGTNEEAAVYTANDIVFYLAGQGFTYGEGTEADEHEQAEADAHTVVHITKPGVYEISGSLSAGQIAVDLGKEAEEDPSAVVTLILNGVDITCTVAPAVIFYNVYECYGDADADNATKDVDTTAAGANVIIADGSVNNVNGSYVARIYKSYTLNEAGTEVVDNKKLHKYDAAFYSKKTMNVTGGEIGDGVLNINAENEGLDSELHLTINGGNIHIFSGNDGINTNEDYVSVTTINGGWVDIVVLGSTGEGDGIDSNGWLVINGGKVTSAAYGYSGDAGIDSDMGIYISGDAQIMATGNMYDHVAGGDQAVLIFTFTGRQTPGGIYELKNEAGETVWQGAPANAFQYLIVADDAIVPGVYTLWCDGVQLGGASAEMGGMRGGFGGMRRPDDGQMPEGMQRPEDMQWPEGMERMTPPEGMELPEGMERMTPPEGMEMPEGMENMTPPEGMERMTPPEGFDRQGGMERGNIVRNEDGTMSLPDGTTVDPSQFGGNRGGMMGGRGGFGGMQSAGEMGAAFVITENGGTFAVGQLAQE